jgi:hypothetical protein
MSTTFKYTLVEFTPAEAVGITGVSNTLQRQWRRPERGYLPANEDGHARFDVYGLGRLLVLKMLSDRGTGPQHAKKIADVACGGITIGALACPGAIGGDPHPLPVFRPDGSLLKPHEDVRGTVGLAQHIVRRTGPKEIPAHRLPARFLIIWADGTYGWESDVQAAIELEERGKHAAARLSGPLTVLDQHLIGRLLFQAAGRPLVQVKRTDR